MIEALTDFHFIRPAALLLAPVAGALWWLWQRRSDPLRGWREQVDPVLLDALVTGRESIRRGPAAGILVAWMLGVVAVAGPTWRIEPSPFADDATPLLILLKADVSMEAPDPAPSRLERARLKITDLAGARRGQPLGLIAYAGSAHLVLPPTRDTATVAQMAAEISPDIMPTPGDRLDLALRKAGEILSEEGAGGSVLVIADSVETPLANLSSEAGMPVQFLGINRPGSPQDESLRLAAKALGGTTEPLSAGGDDVAALIRRAAGTPVAKTGEQGAHWEEAGYWLLPLIGLLFLANSRRETRSVEVPA